MSLSNVYLQHQVQSLVQDVSTRATADQQAAEWAPT